MRMDCGRVAVAAMLAVVGAAAVDHAEAQERTRGIEVRPDNSIGGVELSLRLEAHGRSGGPRSSVRSGEALSVGEQVVLCFVTSADGYVALWNSDAEGQVPTRIYPNEFDAETADQAAARVEGGAETCIGGDDDNFRLVIERPLGEASVYLHYTRDVEQQFSESDFPVIRSTRNPDPRPYASSYLRYRVVD